VTEANPRAVIGSNSGDVPDYGEDARGIEEPSGDLLSRISALAVEQKRKEAELAALEDAVEQKKAEVRDISEFKLPGAMAEAGMATFALADGTKIEIKEAVRASIPKTNPEPAFTYLETHGAADLVKREIKISFGKGEEAWARKFLADLAKRKRPVKAENKKTVHPQTLQAYIREQLEEGVDIPLATFGAFIQKFSKIVLPDAQKTAARKSRKKDEDLF
jgi:hypothetical protein